MPLPITGWQQETVTERLPACFTLPFWPRARRPFGNLRGRPPGGGQRECLWPKALGSVGQSANPRSDPRGLVGKDKGLEKGFSADTRGIMEVFLSRFLVSFTPEQACRLLPGNPSFHQKVTEVGQSLALCGNRSFFYELVNCHGTAPLVKHEVESGFFLPKRFKPYLLSGSSFGCKARGCFLALLVQPIFLNFLNSISAKKRRRPEKSAVIF